MQIRLTNTLTRRKEPFAPADPKRVTMYVCGPTVYNFAHIGNARPPVVFDMLFRLLRHVYGETPSSTRATTPTSTTRSSRAVDRSAACRSTRSPRVRAHLSTTTWARSACCRRRCVRARPRTSPAMIAVIEKLIANGAAYVVPSGVYFSVAADEDYGKLSRPRAGRSAKPARASKARTTSAIRPTSRFGKPPSPASRPGKRRSARAAPAGTSSARP